MANTKKGYSQVNRKGHTSDLMKLVDLLNFKKVRPDKKDRSFLYLKKDYPHAYLNRVELIICDDKINLWVNDVETNNHTLVSSVVATSKNLYKMNEFLER